MTDVEAFRTARNDTSMLQDTNSVAMSLLFGHESQPGSSESVQLFLLDKKHKTCVETTHPASFHPKRKKVGSGPFIFGVVFETNAKSPPGKHHCRINANMLDIKMEDEERGKLFARPGFTFVPNVDPGSIYVR